MRAYFEGWYYKHQSSGATVAIIPGRTNDTSFIQMITEDISYNFTYPLSEYVYNKKNDTLKVGSSHFSKNGIIIDISDDTAKIYGEIEYSGITPIKYDIMGIFKYLPMECYHGIISIRHTLNGYINICGKKTDFTDGIGYIEKDSGYSFPQKYLWIQCNDFDKCSVMLSVAKIPLFGLSFYGCICVVNYDGKEYRMATYLGVKFECSDTRVVLRQGKYLLEVDIIRNSGNKLFAPENGRMTRTIHECASCEARFRFYVKDMLLFDLSSSNASFEYV